MVAALVRPRVDVVDSEFEEPCEVCHVRPTAVLVRITQPITEARGKELDPEVVISNRYFCAEHVGAVNELIDSYRA